MFRSPPDDQPTVTVTIEGDTVRVPDNYTVAAAALTYGLGHTRTSPVSHGTRAPLCMMGVCYECLMIIDGKPNQRACQQLVREGMTIQRQHGTGAA